MISRLSTFARQIYVASRQAVLAPMAIGLAGGIALDNYVPAPLAAYFTAFAILLAGLYAVRNRAAVAVCVLLALSACLGGVLHHHRMRRLPTDHIYRYTAEHGLLVRVRGTIITAPHIPKRDRSRFAGYKPPPGSRFAIEAETLATADGNTPVCGRVQIKVQQPVSGFKVGDRVELLGRLYRFGPAENPGQLDWRLWKHRRSLYAGITCKHAPAVKLIEEASTHPIRRFLAGLRRHARTMLIADIPADEEQYGTLLETLILGERGAIDKRINELFIRLGTAHLLSVSGMHVGLLAAAVWWVMRILGRPKSSAALAVIPLVLIYALLAEPRPPVWRATIMTLTYCVGVLLRRPPVGINWIPLSAIVLLVLNPAALFDVGFQLSFAGVLGIVLIWPQINALLLREDDPLVRLREETPGFRWVRRPGLFLVQLLGVSLAAWLATSPLAALYFNRLSPLGFINTLILLLPVFALVLGGFVKLTGAILFPSATAAVVSPVIAWISEILVWLAELLNKIPGVSFYVPTPPVWLVLLFYLLLCGWYCKLRFGVPLKWPVTTTLIFLIGLTTWWWPRTPEDGLVVTILSVGSASASVIETPDGDVYVYDAGSMSGYDVGKSVVVPYLYSRKIHSLDAVIVSHPNVDHYSGVPSVLERCPTDEVICSSHFFALSPAGKLSARFLDEVQNLGVDIRIIDRHGRLIDDGSVKATALWPPRESAGLLLANDSSLVVRFTFGDQSILFCGDIEETAQAQLLDEADLRADVLILPHHGSVVSTTEAFIDAVNPQYVIRSSAQSNRDTTSTLLEICQERHLFNTADSGAVRIRIAGDQIDVSTFINKCQGLPGN